jgi:hypothetical protein
MVGAHLFHLILECFYCFVKLHIFSCALKGNLSRRSPKYFYPRPPFFSCAAGAAAARAVPRSAVNQRLNYKMDGGFCQRPTAAHNVKHGRAFDLNEKPAIIA